MDRPAGVVTDLCAPSKPHRYAPSIMSSNPPFANGDDGDDDGDYGGDDGYDDSAGSQGGPVTSKPQVNGASRPQLFRPKPAESLAARRPMLLPPATPYKEAVCATTCIVGLTPEEKAKVDACRDYRGFQKLVGQVGDGKKQNAYILYYRSSIK